MYTKIFTLLHSYSRLKNGLCHLVSIFNLHTILGKSPRDLRVVKKDGKYRGDNPYFHVTYVGSTQ